MLSEPISTTSQLILNAKAELRHRAEPELDTDWYLMSEREEKDEF